VAQAYAGYTNPSNASSAASSGGNERGWAARLTVDDEVVVYCPKLRLASPLSLRRRSVPAGDGRETEMAYGFTFRLELEDGTLADAPTFRSAPGVSWGAGDTIPLGRDRKLRVIDTRLDERTDGDPVSVPIVEAA
jgi:hypothetical protein